MSTYRKNVIAWIAIISTALFLGLAAMYLSEWFSILFFSVVLSAHVILKKITCPRCGMPLTYEGDNHQGPLAKLGLPLPSAFFRTHCANCGFDLRQQYKRNKKF